MLTEKRCPKCDTVKPVSSFYKTPQRPDGLSSYCRQCQVAATKSRYSPHPRWRAPEGRKWCPTCETIKPLDQFGNNRTSFDKKQSVCKPCSVAAVTRSRHKDPTSHRRSSAAWARDNPERIFEQRLRKYGITPADYEVLNVRAGGLCEICEGLNDNGQRLAVDHCHDEGHVRGLLCSKCNTGIGQFDHDESKLYAAIKYLQATKRPPK